MTLHDDAPTTAEVRAAYVRDGYSGEAFDLWLADRDARKWDEGATRRAGDSFIRENLAQTLAKNPYRE